MRLALLSLMLAIISRSQTIPFNRESGDYDKPYDNSDIKNGEDKRSENIQLYKCYEITINKHKSEYNDKILPVFANLTMAKSNQYFAKLMYFNINNCLEIFNTVKFAETLKAKQYNISEQLLQDSIISQLPSNISWELNESESNTKANLAKFLKDLEATKNSSSNSSNGTLTYLRVIDAHLIGIIVMLAVVVFIVIKCVLNEPSATPLKSPYKNKSKQGKDD